MDGGMDRLMDAWMDKLLDWRINECMESRMRGWMDGWMNGWTGTWMDWWLDQFCFHRCHFDFDFVVSPEVHLNLLFKTSSIISITRVPRLYELYSLVKMWFSLSRCPPSLKKYWLVNIIGIFVIIYRYAVMNTLPHWSSWRQNWDAPQWKKLFSQSATHALYC